VSPLEPDIIRSILEGLAIGVYVVDLERKILLWNDGAETITGYARCEVIGRSCHDNILAHCDENNVNLCGSACPLVAAMHDGIPRKVEVFLRHKEGQRVPVTVRAVPVRDESGTIIGAAESFDERTLPDPDAALYAADAQLAPDAVIPDAETARLRLAEHLRHYAEDQVPFGVLNIAVDGLAEQKRRRGSEAGEKILRVTASSLVKTLRPTDVVGSWTDGGLLVIAAHCPAAAVVKVGELLRKMVGFETVSWWGDTVPVTISVGGTKAVAGDTVDSILGRSEEALRMSVTGGGDRVTIL
jgi:PAS domain S-box-containing protein